RRRRPRYGPHMHQRSGQLPCERGCGKVGRLFIQQNMRKASGPMTLRTLALIAFSLTPLGAQPNPALVNELVLANHILANEGVLRPSGPASARDDRIRTLFLLASHMAAGVVPPADIVEYDLDSKPVRPNAPTGYTERFIHGEIYRARPDVMAVVHCHSPDLIP